MIDQPLLFEYVYIQENDDYELDEPMPFEYGSIVNIGNQDSYLKWAFDTETYNHSSDLWNELSKKIDRYSLNICSYGDTVEVYAKCRCTMCDFKCMAYMHMT